MVHLSGGGSALIVLADGGGTFVHPTPALCQIPRLRSPHAPRSRLRTIRDGKPVTHTSKLQKIANEKWPERDKDGTAHARNIRPATHDDGTRWTIDVTVRLEFEHDGEVFIDGRAERWANGCVCVRVNDPRVIVGLVWVAAADVRRR